MSSGAQKIVVRGVNWLGDAVMSTSALQRLRQALPNANITLLTHEKLAGLWKDQPFLDEVMVFTSEESPLHIGRRLRWGKFDVGLLFPNSPRTALELWFGKIPERIGYARPWRNLFLTRRIAPRREEVQMHKRSRSEIEERIRSQKKRDTFPASAHHVHHYLHLVAEAFGADPEPLRPSLVVTEQQIEQFKARFGAGNYAGPTFGLNPGAEYGLAKRWPKESFIEAAVSLHAQTGCRWFVFGGKADVPLSGEIAVALARSMPEGSVVNLAGKTSLGELCAALKCCDLLLTNDTGPMHLAAAVGTPVVVPFGSTSPELTGPGLPGGREHSAVISDVPCAPCFLRECPIDFRCLRGISADAVVSAALKRFRERIGTKDGQGSTRV